MKIQSVRKAENAHIFLWLLKDSCWVMDFKIFGVVMIIPTVVVALFITWKTRKVLTELFHNIAVCCWLFANSVWMIGEFYLNDTTRPYAAIFFVAGVLMMTYYYLFLNDTFSQNKHPIEELSATQSPVREKA